MKHCRSIILSALLWCTISFCITACTELPTNVQQSGKLPRIVPDYTFVTIPDGIAPLNFYLDEDCDVIDVTVEGQKGQSLHANGRYADFEPAAWHRLIHENRGDSITFVVCAKHNGRWTRYQPFSIYVSNDALNEWGVTYRRIPPGYESYGLMGIYERRLADFSETPIVENQHIGQNCVNCHSIRTGNAGDFTFHVRGEHGATVVSRQGKTTILAPRNEKLGGSMVYPYWHPSGKFIAYSTNRTHQNFHQLRDKRVEVYDEQSDIIIYNTETHEIRRDSLLATAHRLENYPAFSPDGRWLFFTSSQRVDSIWKNYKDIKYNICRVSFDPQTGHIGNHIDTLVCAARQGKSANMPRLSPDGTHLLYVLSDYGCFPIWHSEADLWMKNLVTGEEQPLTAANSADAESFPRWNGNGHWIVFTSRRFDGLYSCLYFAHVDASGRASKAFRLPQRNPKEYHDETIFSFNTPDFVNAPTTIDRNALYQQLLNEARTPTRLQ